MPCYSEHVCDHSECKEQVDTLTRMLCGVMSAIESCENEHDPQVLIDKICAVPSLRGWWINHKTIDEKRRAAEAETERQRKAERKNIEETDKAFEAYMNYMKNKHKK